MDTSIESLDRASKVKLKGSFPSSRVFMFDNNGRLKSLGSYILPAVLAGKSVTIQIDVFEFDVSLLLSKIALKKLKIKIELDKDKGKIFGQKVEPMQCPQLWSELAGLGPNSDLFGKIGPKKV